MSEYLDSIVDFKKFYILPVCNLPLGASIPTTDYFEDEFWTECNFFGFNTGTTNSNEFNNYNDNLDTIIIPDYLKLLDISFISFSSNPINDTSQFGSSNITTVTFNIEYNMNNQINPFIDGNGNSFNFENQDKYITQLKVPNGSLVPVDFKNIYSIKDIHYTFADFMPVPTTSTADKNNKCRPRNITLWKKFLSKTESNKNQFLKNNCLPASLNTYLNPYFIP